MVDGITNLMDMNLSELWDMLKMVDGITNLMDMNLSELWDMLMDKEGWIVTVHGVAMSWT